MADILVAAFTGGIFVVLVLVRQALTDLKRVVGDIDREYMRYLRRLEELHGLEHEDLTK